VSGNDTREERGLVVVLTGHGKGKTTAALGIALRAAGYRMKVCIVGFIKGDACASGEREGIKRLAPDVELHLSGKGFCGMRGDRYPFEEHRAKAQEALRLARDKMLSGQFDVLVLDEITNAIQLGLVDLSQVLDLLDEKPPAVHIVLTGRDAPTDLIERADTVTEMREIKHAYRQGVGPRKGIDY